MCGVCGGKGKGGRKGKGYDRPLQDAHAMQAQLEFHDDSPPSASAVLPALGTARDDVAVQERGAAAREHPMG